VAAARIPETDVDVPPKEDDPPTTTAEMESTTAGTTSTEPPAARAAEGTHDHHRHHHAQIDAIDVACGKEKMTVRVTFDSAFDGIIYAKVSRLSSAMSLWKWTVGDA